MERASRAIHRDISETKRRARSSKITVKCMPMVLISISVAGIVRE